MGLRPDHDREVGGIESIFGIMVLNHNFTDYNRKRREERNEVRSHWVGASTLFGSPRYRGTIALCFVVLTNPLCLKVVEFGEGFSNDCSAVTLFHPPALHHGSLIVSDRGWGTEGWLTRLVTAVAYTHIEKEKKILLGRSEWEYGWHASLTVPRFNSRTQTK